jgi:DNA-binding NtrC family response regulator
MIMAHVLIVDDARDLCTLLDALLRESGHIPQCVHSGEAAIQAVGERPPDLVLLDVCLEGIDGIESLRRLRASAPDMPIVMMTAFGDVQTAVRAMRFGATDFLRKPFNNKALLSTIETLIATCCEVKSDAPAVVGASPAFRRAMDLALKFAVPDINVMLLGETGTGKELFARRIHAASKRRDGPFAAVDCSMLAENLIESELFGHQKGAFTGATAAHAGRLELARGGTLFLDEIGNLSEHVQAKLLRVLQERSMERVGGCTAIHLDMRIVSATNVNLKEAIQAGRFRQDLYYRLQGMTIRLPPLREREGDIRRIADHFVRLYAARFGRNTRLSDAAAEMLEEYSWPGNVRELENAVKSAVVLAGDVVLPDHLPPEILGEVSRIASVSVASNANGEDERLKLEIEVGLQGREIDLKDLAARAARRAERALLQALISRGAMSAVQMAKLLRLDPKTLRTKLQRYGLEARRATGA